MTLHGILRCESVYKADFSDLCGVRFRTKRDPHPLYILMMQFAEGKTNHGVTLYGRCLRHHDVRLCPVGAFAMYLFWRLDLSGEFSPPPDFTSNKDWFDVKLLSDGQPKGNNRKSMNNGSYGRAIKKLLGELGISTNHYCHLGRVLGPAIAEFHEIDPELICQLANWEVTVHEGRYSQKLPMKILRSMAGFNEVDGMHYNSRTVVEPPKGLLEQVFPFVDVSLAAIESSSQANPNRRHTTAHNFLRMLDCLRRVLLQDAAAMMVMYPERRSSMFFRRNKLFNTDQFNLFVEEMRSRLDEPNPVNASVEAVLPGVNHRLDVLQGTANDIRGVFYGPGASVIQEQMRVVMAEMLSLGVRQLQSMVTQLQSNLARLVVTPGALLGAPHEGTENTTDTEAEAATGESEGDVQMEDAEQNILTNDVSHYSSTRIGRNPESLRRLYYE